MSALLADLLIALRFFSRLPVPETARERELGAAGLAQAAPLVPLAGAIIGLVPALVLAAARALALPPLVAGALAIAALVLVTGALHEDALADCADGFGGGATRERKLAIMRDSRLGTYGALAIGLSLLVRAAAVEAFLVRGGLAVAVAALVAGAAASRGLGLLPLALLAPARADGLARGAGRLTGGALGVAVSFSVAIGLGIPLVTGSGFGRPALALALAFVASVGISDLARRQIGGVTGDVAGAAQQLCEVAILLGLLIGAEPS